jgi:tol-pal system protein YbgF
VRRLACLALLGVAAACATPAQVRQVETQVGILRADSRRTDSANAAQLREIIALQKQVMDSLAATRRALAQVKGDVSNDLYNIQQQLVQLQELTGQSQRRLTELRGQLDARSEQLNAPPPAPAGAPDTSRGPAAPVASAQQMFDASLGQLRRGSAGTARAGLRELLQSHPTSELVPDALYYVGQSYSSENPDSAAFYYRRVVQEYPASPRAAAALYSLGLLAERRGDRAGARSAYDQLLKSHPKSDEAALARDRLKAIGR